MSTIQKGKWQHYKGNYYEVIDIVRDSETLEELVLYKALYTSKEFGEHALRVRAKKKFFENIIIDDKEIQRFRYISA